MKDHEKAFEFDRAKQALARTGRTGGLVYELAQVLDRLTELDRPTHTPANTPTIFGFDPARPNLQPGDTVTLRHDPSALLTVTSTGIVYADGTDTTVCWANGYCERAHSRDLVRVPPTNRPFKPGDTVTRTNDTRLGIVRATPRGKDSRYIYVSWETHPGPVGYRADELRRA